MGIGKKIAVGVGAVLGILSLGAGGFVYTQTQAFDGSLAKKYDVPLPAVTVSTDPAIIERGKHISESFGACASSHCHNADLSGGETIAMGPVGTITGPNISARIPKYSDGELARLIRHCIKKDGTSTVLMPCQEFGWMSLDDVGALISYLRTVKPVDKADGPLEVKVLGKILDRQDKLALDVARHINHAERAKEAPPAPSPTAAYGAYLAKTCQNCHGEGFSGGPIPGAPASMAVPRNITLHETGIKTWTYENFEHAVTKGERPDGKKLDSLMPTMSEHSDTERKALWAYMQTLPPKTFGGR